SEGRLLRHVAGDRLIGGAVVVNAVSASNSQGVFRRRSPCKAETGRKIVAVRMHKGSRQVPGVCARLPRLYWGDGGIAWGNVQVDQAIVELGYRSRVVPAYAELNAERRPDTPVVVYVGVIPCGPEILVRVAITYGTGGRHPQQEIRQVIARAGLGDSVDQEAGRRA